MLFSACVNMSSCDKDDDPQTENNGNTSDGNESEGNGSNNSSFKYNKSSMDAMVSRCKTEGVVRDGNRLFAFYNNFLNIYEFSNDVLSSISACHALENDSLAQIAYNNSIAPNAPYMSYMLVGNYLVATSIDPDYMASVKNLTIDQLQAYLPIAIKSKEEEDIEDITSPKYTPAEASVFCNMPGEYLQSGKNKLYINQNDTLKSLQFSYDKIVSVSIYKDYKTEENVLGAYEDALLTSKDMGVWSTEGTFLVVTTNDADVLKPYMGMTLDDVIDSLENNK